MSSKTLIDRVLESVHKRGVEIFTETARELNIKLLTDTDEGRIMVPYTYMMNNKEFCERNNLSMTTFTKWIRVSFSARFRVLVDQKSGEIKHVKMDWIGTHGADSVPPLIEQYIEKNNCETITLDSFSSHTSIKRDELHTFVAPKRVVSSAEENLVRYDVEFFLSSMGHPSTFDVVFEEAGDECMSDPVSILTGVMIPVAKIGVHPNVSG